MRKIHWYEESGFLLSRKEILSYFGVKYIYKVVLDVENNIIMQKMLTGSER